MSAVSKPLMALFTWPLWIFFARTLDRFGKGIRTSARDAILSDETTPEHKGKVFGFHRAMDTVGAALGPAFALLFLAFYPGQYKWLFIIAFIPGVIAVGLTFFLKDKPVSPQGNGETGKQGIKSPSLFGYLKYWKHASFDYRFLVTGLLLFTLFNSSDAFLLLALKSSGQTDQAMIGFYIFYNLVYALFSYPVGAIADRIGLKTMLTFGLLVFSIVYFFMGFASSFLAFGILFLLYGIYAASTEGISKAIISNLAAKSETATAIGFYNSLASICTMAASTLAGLLWFSAGPRIMFIISGAGVFCISCVFFVYFMLNKFRKGSQHQSP
jgi:MFS family permease